MNHAESGRSVVILLIGGLLLTVTGVVLGWTLGSEHAEEGGRDSISVDGARERTVEAAETTGARESATERSERTRDVPTERERRRMRSRPTPEPASPDDPDAVLAEMEPVVASWKRQLDDLVVERGETRHLPAGEVTVSGNLRIEGEIDASRTTLVLDGADQTLDGKLLAKRIIVRNGFKRLRGTFGTMDRAVAAPGQAGLYVEAGTTLQIESGGRWTTPGPYGFQIAGTLLIDGGEFHCTFTNGDGTERGEDSWLSGSRLEIRTGKFVADGDADFRGASIVIHSGELLINDDLWHTGDSLLMYGGLLRNSRGGGKFTLSGNVNMSGGKMVVGHSARRGLSIYPGALVNCTGGTVIIDGRRALTGDGGIHLARGATFFDLQINTSTRIHPDSATDAYLAVSGELRIGKDEQLIANGRRVITSFVPTDDSGELVR